MPQSDYEKKLAEIQIFPEDKLKTIHTPVSVLIEEAETLYIWCQDDKETLIKRGVDWQVVEDLPVRARALLRAQALWLSEYLAGESPVNRWLDEVEKAREFRSNLIHHFYYAYRNHPDKLDVLKGIAGRISNDDLIQGFQDMLQMYTDNPGPVDELNVYESLTDKLNNYVKILPKALAANNNTINSENPRKILRDKAYFFLREAMDEIRQLGKYVFWHDEKRKQGYVSTYNKANKLRVKEKRENGI